jgi:hypothetical protein
MRRDPDVVLAAVANKGYAMKYAGPELVEDPAWMMKVVQECSRTYKYAGIKAYEFSPLGLNGRTPACQSAHVRTQTQRPRRRARAD